MAEPDSPYQSTIFPTAAAPFARRHLLWCLVAFYSLAVLSAARNVAVHVFGTPDATRFDLLMQIGFAFCLASWAVFDARRRRQSIPLLLQPWFLMFALVSVPGYVVWTRGWRGVGWVLLHSVCWIGLTIVAQIAMVAIARQ